MIAKKKEDVRRLALNKETLRQLSAADLRRAVGGFSAVYCWATDELRRRR